MNADKNWWASKTVWLGILELAIGGLSLLADSQFTRGDAKAVLLATAGILTVILRFLTYRPMAPIRAKKID